MTTTPKQFVLYVQDDLLMQRQRNTGELRHSKLASLIPPLYRLLNCRRRWRIGRILMAVALRLEGGPMRSATARKLMHDFHDTEIGAYSYGGECFDPAIPPGIRIGRFVSIATGVRMFVNNHPLDRLSTHPFFYEHSVPVDTSDASCPRLEIGNDVWIGCNAIITPGCRRVGNGAVIGAGSVVTKDVPDFAIVAGSPAKRLRDRFSSEVAERLLESKWWLFSEAEIRLRMVELNQLLKENLDDSLVGMSESK